MDDPFSKLADALGPSPNAPRYAPYQAPRPKKSRPEPDRSRDHAIYAAPHRPPTSSAPAFDDVTLRRPRHVPVVPVLVPLPNARGRSPSLALAFALVFALGAFALAFLACAAP